MFAIADGRMKDGINDIRRLAGLWPPTKKKIHKQSITTGHVTNHHLKVGEK